ncbi:hypothetical protein WAI453_008408 [Rhynchosporium graminicola]
MLRARAGKDSGHQPGSAKHSTAQHSRAAQQHCTNWVGRADQTKERTRKDRREERSGDESAQAIKARSTKHEAESSPAGAGAGAGAEAEAEAEAEAS